MKGMPFKAMWAAGLLAVPCHVAALDADSPLLQGWYVAPMYSHVEPDNDRRLDAGQGATLSVGYRVSEEFALEVYGVYGKLDRQPVSSSATMSGGGIGALAFLSDAVPGLYLPFAVGYLETDSQALSGSRYKGLSFEAGLGYLLPLSFGRYDFALRAEARYRHNNGQDSDDLGEVAKPGLEDALFNLGLQLPLGRRSAPPVEPAVAVVPVLPACSDGVDNDGDGLVDYPNDPGCSSASDDDERDPPQCSDGRDNDGDGLIDYPDDPGCSSAQDDDETDPCKTPVPGERVSLLGCGTGDVIVLHGVNFEHDQARLTVNAQSILDQVVSELSRYPDIQIEIGGHTDSVGSDAYNQRLSERRAASVVDYLSGEGIARDRMSAAGYGEAQPVADNETAEGRERNRRVELKITTGVAAP